MRKIDKLPPKAIIDALKADFPKLSKMQVSMTRHPEYGMDFSPAAKKKLNEIFNPKPEKKRKEKKPMTPEESRKIEEFHKQMREEHKAKLAAHPGWIEEKTETHRKWTCRKCERFQTYGVTDFCPFCGWDMRKAVEE